MNLDLLVEHTCFEHSNKVSEISAILAECAGYSSDESAVIKQAALYHDVGKTDIPAQILNKPGALSPEEFDLVKTHTRLGHSKILDTISILSVAADVCRDHHERLDGTGYGGLMDSSIHQYTKLISVADVFDALYSKRSYKEGWDIERIRSYFQAQSGIQFDAEIVTILFIIIERILELYQNKTHFCQNTH